MIDEDATTNDRTIALSREEVERVLEALDIATAQEFAMTGSEKNDEPRAPVPGESEDEREERRRFYGEVIARTKTLVGRLAHFVEPAANEEADGQKEENQEAPAPPE